MTRPTHASVEALPVPDLWVDDRRRSRRSSTPWLTGTRKGRTDNELAMAWTSAVTVGDPIDGFYKSKALMNP